MRHIRVLTFFCAAALPFVIVFCPCIALPQAVKQAAPSYKSASVIPSRSGYVPGPPAQTDEYFAWTGRTLKELLGYAYRLRSWQIRGGPDWLDSDRWDLEATAERKIVNSDSRPFDLNTPSEMQLMLQSVLQDRFRLKIKRARELSEVFNLVRAKSGLKIKLDDDQSPPVPNKAKGLPPQHMDSSWDLNDVPRGSYMIIGGPPIGTTLIEARAVPIAAFVTGLLSFSDRPIIDRTELSGLYNIRLKWAEYSGTGNLTGASRINRGFGPAFLKAIQEQLGLKMEAAKAPTDMLIIIRAQKPLEK